MNICHLSDISFYYKVINTQVKKVVIVLCTDVGGFFSSFPTRTSHLSLIRGVTNGEWIIMLLFFGAFSAKNLLLHICSVKLRFKNRDFFPPLQAAIWLVDSASPVAEAGFWPISAPETKVQHFKRSGAEKLPHFSPPDFYFHLTGFCASGEMFYYPLVLKRHSGCFSTIWWVTIFTTIF